MSAHCPRCGATLPQDDEVLCTSCGFTRGHATVALEVTPDELMAELERRAETEGVLEGEISKVVTTPSGLLATRAGAAAVAAVESAQAPRPGLMVWAVVLGAIVALAIVIAFVAS